MEIRASGNLVELGIPNVRIIRRIRLANLLVRLKTLPAHITPAALHGFLAARPALQTTFEAGMRTNTQELHLMEIWQDIQATVQSLARPQGAKSDPVTRLRTHWGKRIKKHAWEMHRNELTSGKTPDNTKNIKRYVNMTRRDLQRTPVGTCHSAQCTLPRV